MLFHTFLHTVVFNKGGELFVRLLKLIVQKNVFVILLMIFIILIGSYTFIYLEKELTPEVNFNGASIDVEAKHLNIDDVERNITKPFEQKLQDIDGIKEISSTTSLGHSFSQVLFDNGKGNELFKDIEVKTSLVLSDAPGVNHI